MTWPPAPGEEPVSSKQITTLDWLTGQQHLDQYQPPEPGSSNGNGHQVTIVQPPGDGAGTWLRLAGIALGGLAAAAAAVSYQAQYQLIYAEKHQHVVSCIQAGIPDIGSLVFACLGIALALHGRRALRPPLLNVLCVGISIAMNALAAASRWPATAGLGVAPVVYALASDPLIGVL